VSHHPTRAVRVGRYCIPLSGARGLAIELRFVLWVSTSSKPTRGSSALPVFPYGILSLLFLIPSYLVREAQIDTQ
jgi:hypothetical protein